MVNAAQLKAFRHLMTCCLRKFTPKRVGKLAITLFTVNKLNTDGDDYIAELLPRIIEKWLPDDLKYEVLELNQEDCLLLPSFISLHLGSLSDEARSQLMKRAVEKQHLMRLGEAISDVCQQKFVEVTDAAFKDADNLGELAEQLANELNLQAQVSFLSDFLLFLVGVWHLMSTLNFLMETRFTQSEVNLKIDDKMPSWEYYEDQLLHCGSNEVDRLKIKLRIMADLNTVSSMLGSIQLKENDSVWHRNLSLVLGVLSLGFAASAFGMADALSYAQETVNGSARTLVSLGGVLVCGVGVAHGYQAYTLHTWTQRLQDVIKVLQGERHRMEVLLEAEEGRNES